MKLLSYCYSYRSQQGGGVKSSTQILSLLSIVLYLMSAMLAAPSCQASNLRIRSNFVTSRSRNLNRVSLRNLNPGQQNDQQVRILYYFFKATTLVVMTIVLYNVWAGNVLLIFILR